jgi:hypothetical protein
MIGLDIIESPSLKAKPCRPIWQLLARAGFDRSDVIVLASSLLEPTFATFTEAPSVGSADSLAIGAALSRYVVRLFA